jgi:YVTN family beta-propeller protein
MKRHHYSSSAARRAGILPAAAILLSLAPRLGAAQHEGHGQPAPKPQPPAPTAVTAQAIVRDSAAGAVGAPDRRVVQNGVAVEYSLVPTAGDTTTLPAGTAGIPTLLQQRQAVLRLKLTDAKTGRPLAGLAPAAWIDRRASAALTAADGCKAKVDGYVQAHMYMEGSLKKRANVDLTSYFVLSLNRSPDITVIDPFLGFGRTKLYTTVRLKGIGEDWKLTQDQHRLFVSMPQVGEVAIVNTDDWKVLANVAAGPSPRQLALTPDERFLWVANAPVGADSAPAKGGVTVIDVEGRKVAATIPTGVGPHVVAFSDDGALAFVTNQRAGTVSVIDARTFAKLGDVRTGARPVDLAYSPASRALYVAHEGDGTVAVVNGRELKVTQRIKLAPGLKTIRFTPPPAGGHGAHGGHGGPAAGQYGFVLNPRTNAVTILDARTNEILRTTEIPDAPDQIAFTGSFAYVRSTGSPKISMIPLADPAAGGVGRLDQFEAGNTPPREGGPLSRAAAVVSAPDMPDAVYVLNPKEKMIYYYHYMEGMPIPSGGLTTYGFDPTAVLVAGKDLRETEPGVYSATVKLTDRGDYDVVFLLDDPRVMECFPLTVAANPAAHAGKAAVDIKPVGERMDLRVGDNNLRFRITDLFTNAPQTGLEGVAVVAVRPDGWQRRAPARAVGDGVYEVSLAIPQAGVYYLSFQAASIGLRFNDRPPMVLQVKAAEAAPKP